MKHLTLVLASMAVALLPTVPARASLVAETPPAVDNMRCLTLLLTDPEAHAAECGGPFTTDQGTTPLVKGTFGKGCQQVAVLNLPFASEGWPDNASDTSRIRVAGPVVCCAFVVLAPELAKPQQFYLTSGEVFRFRVAC